MWTWSISCGWILASMVRLSPSGTISIPHDDVARLDAIVFPDPELADHAAGRSRACPNPSSWGAPPARVCGRRWRARRAKAAPEAAKYWRGISAISATDLPITARSKTSLP